ncbi:ATP-dependent RNA helicase mtr4 [Coemansia thaxteri]|nr:ATP-dependent RNA helicase mtr4 [Coemansia thaxteri]KAJ2474079.1 ATP-dependent RNA helicase mtr4 [Coemansia sp. RSA 2322]
MDTNALFDVFNDGIDHGSSDSSDGEEHVETIPKQQPPAADSSKLPAQTKRRHQQPRKDNPDLAPGSDMDEDDPAEGGDGIHKQKKLKQQPPPRPDAIVLDSFEEDLQREVKPAGLDTSAADKETGSVVLSHSVRHQVSIPPDYNYVPLSRRPKIANPARQYPFTLDPFQQASVQCIDSNESVLVAAHTSAGKTVVAEYAIAQCLRDKQRVIYTSPIKALSNQKYREFLEEFGDVGLMTGDVTINPQASCLVMTTEILRSMLYRGSEVMREVAWVVFDEIHYMRDKERGVVWEETIILLPHQVRFVFLSATIPNAMQFAEWITKTHEQPCHVVYTDFRPTPLQHYLFPQGGDGIHLVVDEKSQFREDNFQRAIAALQDAQGQAADDVGKRGAKTNKGKQGNSKTDVYKIVKMIMARNYHPVIVFCFSKRECEGMALQMSKLDFNEEAEKDMVSEVFNNAIGSLGEDDRGLPQIENILPLLRRGIGIHHSGLLPILKEVIEILFQEGLLKCLFATETFSIGLNMPARTVVFTSVRKFDGKDFRWVMSGEYIQMSGRAGRRGLDDRGVVILMLDEKMEPAIAKDMVKGEPDVLNSAFHLSYNMILNLMRVETFTPQYMLERSFHQFQTHAEIPRLELEAAELEAELAQIKIEDEPAAKRFYDLRTQLDAVAADVARVVVHPSNSLPFLQPGRLVRVNTGGLDFGWGCVVFFQRKAIAGKRGDSRNPRAAEEEARRAGADGYIVDVLLHCRRADRDATHKLETAAGATTSSLAVVPCDVNDTGPGAETLVVPVLLSSIDRISTVRVHMAKDVTSAKERGEMRRRIAEVGRRLEGRVPLLDPAGDMGIRDAAFAALAGKAAALEAKLHAHRLFGSPDEAHVFGAYAAKAALQARVRDAQRRIGAAQSAVQLDELRSRQRVLRRLGYTTAEDVITIKGRVACEITSGDELLLAELMFHGVFNDLTTEQTAALLSCFVFQEKSKDGEPPKLAEDLAAPLRAMQESARQIAQIANECKLRVVEEEYVASFRPELMDVVNAWCRGAKFSQICRMTDVFEGSLIRAFRRLEELLRQMCMAAKAIGNVDLENKFADGITKIKRDIIFAASLYLLCSLEAAVASSRAATRLASAAAEDALRRARRVQRLRQQVDATAGRVAELRRRLAQHARRVEAAAHAAEAQREDNARRRQQQRRRGTMSDQINRAAVKLRQDRIILEDLRAMLARQRAQVAQQLQFIFPVELAPVNSAGDYKAPEWAICGLRVLRPECIHCRADSEEAAAALGAVAAVVDAVARLACLPLRFPVAPRGSRSAVCNPMAAAPFSPPAVPEWPLFVLRAADRPRLHAALRLLATCVEQLLLRHGISVENHQPLLPSLAQLLLAVEMCSFVQ